MPGNVRSLRLTETYRRRMVALRRQGEQIARQAWNAVSLDDLDGTYAVPAQAIAALQRTAAQTSAAYLTAFVSSELGRRVAAPRTNAADYAGRSWDGQSLFEGLRSPLIGVKAALGASEQVEPREVLAQGGTKLVRNAGLDIDFASRDALKDLMEADERIEGWKRAVKGTCDACLGLADEATAPPGTPLEIHPGCECVSEPVVRGVRDRIPRPSGKALFAALTVTQQNEQFGEEKAQALRDEEISLADCVDHSRIVHGPDFVTARPLNQINA